MANPQLQYLPDKIMSKIVELVGQESVWYLGAFMRAGKRGYELVHQPSILKTCNVALMVNKYPCEIGIYGKFREFFLKCVGSSNIDAVYNEGLHRSTCSRVAEGIKVLEANVPTHGSSALVVGIFYVCVGEDIEASNVFQQFVANHVDLNFDAISEMGDELQSRLIQFHAPFFNTYGPTLKYPDNDVVKTPTCLYGHTYDVEYEEGCKY